MISPRKNHDSITPPLASFSGLCSLKRLILRDCNLSEGAIPSDLGSLSSLEMLDLENSSFCSLPSSIGFLSRLSYLDLRNCTRLQSLPMLPSSLRGLYADDCTSLESLSNLSNIKQLDFFTLQNCSKLIKIPGLVEFESISVIVMERFLQGMSEGGRYGIILPMSEIPEWFEYQSEGSSMSFKLGPRLGYEIQGLIICSIYAAGEEFVKARFDEEMSISATIEIQGTKSEEFGFGIILDLVSHQDHMWVKYEPLPFYLCEERVPVDIEIITEGEFQVKKCGVHVVYLSSDNASTVKFQSNTLEF